MTSEWPTIDPSADLFGGDLFGDELLDMYNPSVARKSSQSILEICILYNAYHRVVIMDVMLTLPYVSL